MDGVPTILRMALPIKNSLLCTASRALPQPSCVVVVGRNRQKLLTVGGEGGSQATARSSAGNCRRTGFLVTADRLLLPALLQKSFSPAALQLSGTHMYTTGGRSVRLRFEAVFTLFTGSAYSPSLPTLDACASASLAFSALALVAFSTIRLGSSALKM